MQLINVLIEGNFDIDTQERKPCADRGRDWSDRLISQGLPRVIGCHQKPGDSPEQVLPQGLQKETTL